MFRKILATILAVAVLSAVPVMMCGCEKHEYKSRSEYKETDKPVSQEPVVD